MTLVCQVTSDFLSPIVNYFCGKGLNVCIFKPYQVMVLAKREMVNTFSDTMGVLFAFVGEAMFLLTTLLVLSEDWLWASSATHVRNVALSREEGFRLGWGWGKGDVGLKSLSPLR